MIYFIIFSRESIAEKLPLASESVQLVTSCQACHWFDLPAFFKEVDRVLVPGKDEREIFKKNFMKGNTVCIP